MAKKMETDVFQYKNVKIEHLYPAATIAAQYVKQNLPDCKKVRYIGMEATGEEIRSNGIETIGGTKGDEEFQGVDNYMMYENIKDYKFDPEVGAVISGIDFAVSYSKIALASMYIQKGAKWVVTNEDGFTMQHGLRAPGNGMIIAALESSLKKPGGEGLICDKIVTGKPNPAIFDLIRGQHNIPESETPKFIMIGDRPDTDIALGNNGKVDTCLVLSGVVRNEEEIQAWAAQSEKYQPTYVMNSFGEDIKLTEEELANM